MGHRQEEKSRSDDGQERFHCFPHFDVATFGGVSSASKRAPRSASVTMERGSAMTFSVG